MRFVVYGAGAIGGVVGARLFQAGNDVVLIARGPHLDAIQRHGLTLQAPDEEVTMPIPAVGDPAAAGLRAGDVVLLAMKSQDTEAAVDAIAVTGVDGVAVVSLQNGVENERVALRRHDAVYGGCVMCPALHLEAGVVVAYASPLAGIIDVGRYPTGSDDTTEAIAAAFTAASLESVPRSDIMRWKHSKLVMNLGNVVEAVFAPDERLPLLVRAARREGTACLRTAGIDFASADEDRERRGDLLQVHPVSGADRPGGSTWQSVARGGALETDHLNGEVVLLGRVHGVPTPVNDLLQRVARAHAAKRAAPGSLAIDAVADQLPSGTIDHLG